MRTIINHSMNKTLETLKHQLTKTRTGRASPTVLDGVMVDYYGVPTPIKYRGLFSGMKGAHQSTAWYISSLPSPTETPPMA